MVILVGSVHINRHFYIIWAVVYINKYNKAVYIISRGLQPLQYKLDKPHNIKIKSSSPIFRISLLLINACIKYKWTFNWHNNEIENIHPWPVQVKAK